ncbi:MAG: hypothetical protein K9J37_21320 [Saprospiraceae bacterium]|nr:hypothetical protein [Saprospiraceae bacterium]MCF8252462.1 hypothetical protein [Saprospiraceae bacterium]MCF8282329.1 hypothetical protein [Bacteroidales bacterium]MCF8314051.1 hypothetical protein [Saprospiraceae bacterium]MCF8442789.1 hypothetical protein [Saprospiraceae bacterium]
MNEAKSDTEVKNQDGRYIRVSFFRFAAFEMKGYNQDEVTLVLKKIWWFPLIAVIVIIVVFLVFGEKVIELNSLLPKSKG